jgi:hypothetical protein
MLAFGHALAPHDIHLTLFETVVIGLLLLIYAQILRIKNR